MNPYERVDIVSVIGMPAMLGQLAEECCELGKAALKLQRVITGRNPTPVTYKQAVADLTEEATDVRDCLNLIDREGYVMYDIDQSKRKMDRWSERILKNAEAQG